MTLRSAVAAAIGALLFAHAASAQEAPARPAHAVGVDMTFSTDADDTNVLKLGTDLDWRYHGPEEYQGIRLEQVWYRPQGLARKSDQRIYFRMADRLLNDWSYGLSVGTDGDTVLGSASIHDKSPFRKEVFVERDKVETPVGVTRGLYSTFGGASIDIPFSETTQLTLLGGLQSFTGANVRTHLRANFIQVIKSDWGLSAQLRTRYFRNSDPFEYDYYSPRWYAEVLPVLQVRRYSNGWRYLAAAGLGAQRDSRSDWRQSRYLHLRVDGPSDRVGWSVNGDLTYTNQPITNSNAYDYLRITTGIRRAF